MTQRRHINDLEKSLKVAEKRLQLVIRFTCVVIVFFVLLLCVIFSSPICFVLLLNEELN